MNRRTFKQGIHPLDDGKASTKDNPVRAMRPTGEAVYPLNQHLGAPSKPVVAVGDAVLVGQTLAAPSEFVSAAICSAVSGTVKAIEPRRAVNGRQALCIVVENDGRFEAVSDFDTPRTATQLSAQEILDIIRDAGIVGQGGAGFPTHVKLTAKPGVQLQTIIVNAVECEPYLTSDYRLMLERPEQLVEGLQVVLQLFPHAKGVIAVEDNKPEAIRLLRQTIQGNPRLLVQELKTKYPQGGERMLIHAVTGRDIHSGKLPMEVGCVVLNVSTVVSIWRAVCRRVPQISTIMTVAGDGAATPCNIEVPVGTSYREVLESAGGMNGEPEKMIAGGPMMGLAMVSLDVPVQKTDSALLLMLEDEVAQYEPTACIRCGRCVRACPSFLVPPTMARAADHNALDCFQAVHGMECIECGCCTYVCPAKRRLTQSFKTAKAAVKQQQRRRAEQKAGK